MDSLQLYALYRQLQSYVGWTDDDAARVRAIAPLVEASFPLLVDDFYTEIERHEQTRRVITGGAAQIARLKQTLIEWLRRLTSGQYDEAYVAARYRVGRRHVDIGLPQVYTNVALSRLRSGLMRALAGAWNGPREELATAAESLDKLLDLDLAIIEDAYQNEHLAQQQRIQRLITIGQMAGGLAHELRNPLNVVKTSIYYLRNARQLTEEKQSEHLERIHRQVGLANDVITALSDYAKLPMPEMQPVSAAALCEQTLSTAALPENIAVRIELPADLPRAWGDPRQLAVVVSNLLRNAADAMPTGGVIDVTGGAVGDEVWLAVIDHGVGIEPENLRRIMEPLFSTKARGIGLGLAISRAIVENHGGRISIESQVGSGSRFTVFLHAALSSRDASPVLAE